MKVKQLLIALALFCTVSAFAKDPAPAKEKPIPIEQLRKNFLEWKFGMFIHFNMASYHSVGWANGYEDPASFRPDKLDCEQWAKAAASAGMKYAVLTVKHAGGWCLWDTKTTKTHKVTAFPNYKQGDIFRKFVDACRKYNLKVGLYYANPGKSGKPPKGKRKSLAMPPEFHGYRGNMVKEHMTELLSNYGKIDLVWIDHAHSGGGRRKWVKALQPNCLFILNNGLLKRGSDVNGYEYPWTKLLPKKNNKIPSEVCDKLGPRWFWDPNRKNWKLRSAKDVVRMLELCNSRNSNYLLNVAPDTSGLIPEKTVKRLEEVGKLLGVK